MSKRFPIPEFDRDRYKNLSWSAPALLPREERERRIAAARQGDPAAYGCHAIEADAPFLEHFRFRGPHSHALLCLFPPRGVHLLGRSWAWPIHRALVASSLDPNRSPVLQDWTTPRPMNTRLGPDAGVAIEGGIAYVVLGHRYGDHWIVNRTLVRSATDGKPGFEIVSACDDDANDFHACNLTFTWQ